MPRRFEYKYLEFHDDITMIKILNQLGEEGWEATFHFILRGPGVKHCVLMKRTYKMK